MSDFPVQLLDCGPLGLLDPCGPEAMSRAFAAAPEFLRAKSIRVKQSKPTPEPKNPSRLCADCQEEVGRGRQRCEPCQLKREAAARRAEYREKKTRWLEKLKAEPLRKVFQPGANPTQSCAARRQSHASCSGRHRQNHGVQGAVCTCDCHQKARPA